MGDLFRGPENSRHRALAASVVLIAAFVRAIRIGHRPLWLDEASAALIAFRPPTAIVDAMTRDSNPPVFHWLLHFWIKIFGTSEVAVRSLPLILGVLSVLAIIMACWELFPSKPRVGLMAGAIAAMSPIHVYYSQECRMYTLTVLLGALAFLTLHRFLTLGRKRDMIAHSSLLTIGLYTHNYFLFILPLAPVAALLTPGVFARRRALNMTLIAVAAAGVLYIPWLPVLLRQSRSGLDWWIPEFWRDTPAILAPFRSFEVMGVGGAFPGYLRQLGLLGVTLPVGWLWTVVRIVADILAGVLVINGFRVALREPGERDGAVRLGILLVLPILLPIVVSFTIRPIYLVGRYEVVVFVAYAMLVGRGLEALISSTVRTRRAAGFAAATLWVACAALCLTVSHRAQMSTDEKQLAEWIRSRVGPTDVVILPGFTRAVPEYYLTRWSVSCTRLSFPEEVAEHPGWFNSDKTLRDAEKTQAEAAVLARNVGEAVPSGGRVYLVASTATPQEINGWVALALHAVIGNATIQTVSPRISVVEFGSMP